jgi:trehalose 6-phosphate phosphatase
MNYLLFLDYDGTLTPIVRKPGMAELSRFRKKLLKALARRRYLRVAIVSGRMLSDITKRVGIRNIYYVGNHGFEIAGPGLRFIHPRARAAQPSLRKIKKELERRLKHIKGIIIEDKKLTMSLHYRLVKTSGLNKVREVFRRAAAPHLKARKIRVTQGKKVFEIRPNADWDKGRAVLWLAKKLDPRQKAVPVYIGDDTTDEDAFRALKKRGITIRVGRSKKTSAQRQLKDVDAVYRFLGRISEQM